MTDAEQYLWKYLRNRQLGNFKFRRQHPFDDYILDFVCLEARLAIEVDGGQHAENVESDAERSAHLKRSGFRILRFWNNEVLNNIDGVMQTIGSTLHDCTPPPSQPSP